MNTVISNLEWSLQEIYFTKAYFVFQRVISMENGLKTTTRSCLALGTTETCGTIEGDVQTDCCIGDLCNDDEFTSGGDIDTSCDETCECDCECVDNCDECCTECCNQDLEGKALLLLYC